MTERPDEIRATVLERFTETALAPEQVENFPLGPDSAKFLGYHTEEIDELPASVIESFCGVGNLCCRSRMMADRLGASDRFGRISTSSKSSFGSLSIRIPDCLQQKGGVGVLGRFYRLSPATRRTHPLSHQEKESMIRAAG